MPEVLRVVFRTDGLSLISCYFYKPCPSVFLWTNKSRENDIVDAKFIRSSLNVDGVIII